MIRAESKREFLRLSHQSPNLVFYEAALLTETGGSKDFDGILLIESPLNIRLNHLMERDKTDLKTAENILKNQTSDENRREIATWILINDGTLLELKNKTKELVSSFQK